ncbi:hypothetical protein Tsubulata_008111 [Turnera subulata]|uniref:Agglutinin domain-containing protein n=1 Tax=Turnera subulata TaxID=218843 RepID=A0A9Q0JIT2_9ROSI|nr:hypothetical protein Tsubulata_008111 [Turnera subulata]
MSSRGEESKYWKLPKFLALQSTTYDDHRNNRYLRYMRKAEGEDLHQHLQFSEKEIVKPWGSDGGTFLVIDWDSLVILPTYVAFKGDNGMYLKAFEINRRNHNLQFSTENDTDIAVGNEIFPTGDDHGSIRIKSIRFNLFWKTVPTTRRSLSLFKASSRNWIQADAGNESAAQLFLPRRVADSDNTITLHLLGTGTPCRRLTSHGKKDCLAALSPTAKEDHMKVEECVKERVITNVRYHYSDVRIFSKKINRVFIQTGKNRNKEAEDTMTFKYTSGRKRTSTWKSSITKKVAATVKIKAGIPLPVPAFAEFAIAGETDKQYAWEEAKELSEGHEASYTATIPANKTVEIYATEEEVSYDIPYTYDQLDTLHDGTVISKKDMDDGIYSCKYCYNYKFESDVVTDDRQNS